MIWTLSVALAAPVTPPDYDTDLWRYLSARHPTPCPTLFEVAEPTVPELLAIVVHAKAPAWAPMRAAHCLVKHRSSVPEVAEALREWVVKPEWRGLGRLVLTYIDDLDPGQAVVLGTLAWEADLDRDFIRRRFAESPQPQVRAIVTSSVEPQGD